MSGEILGWTTLLLGDGPQQSRFNVLITGDGFANTISDQELLNDHADEFVAALQRENWFQILGSAINVYRLNIASEDSGVTEPVLDHEGNCTGEFTSRSTYFDAWYPCDDNGHIDFPDLNRDTIAALHDQAELLPLVVHVIGIALNRGRGFGWAGPNFFVLGAEGWQRSAIHEFAHAAFNVGDEYEDVGVRTRPEPGFPNVTRESTLDTLKWKHFIFPNVPTPALQNPNVPIPTLQNPNPDVCAASDLPNPLDNDLQIGLFEGASHNACAVYRPAYKCKMRDSLRRLCPVCIDAGRKYLSPYARQVPAPHAEVITSDNTLSLDFGDVPFGETMYRSFEIRNSREGWPAPLEVTLSARSSRHNESSDGSLGTADYRFNVEVAGSVDANLTWEKFRYNDVGQIGAASVVEIPFEIMTAGEISVDVWSAVTDPPQDVRLGLQLKTPSGLMVESSPTDNARIDHTVGAQGPFGTYTLVVTNYSRIESDFIYIIYAQFHLRVVGYLAGPSGHTVARFEPDTSPATLSYAVSEVGLGVATGEYTLRLVNNSWPEADYKLEVTYPRSNPVLDAPFAFASGTETSFILPAPVIEEAWSRNVWVSFTAPDDERTIESTFDIYTNDPANEHFQITLTGKSVAPQPLDSVLVIDHSGSMGEPTGIPNVSKSEMAVSAGKLFVSLLRDGDRIGIVQFNDLSNDPEDILLEMTEADAPGKEAASTVLDAGLATFGATSIGAGIIRGSTVLDEPDILPRRAIVVLTDGIQNTPPDIRDAEAIVQPKNPPQSVFAIGFGLNQLQDTLTEIATATNGWTQITGELAGWREFILQKLYVQILADATNETIIKDPREVVLSGESRSTEIYLTTFDHSADFIVLFRPSKTPHPGKRVALETPDGQLVGWPSGAGVRGIQIIEGDSHVCFRVGSLRNSGVGLWRVWVENAGRSSGENSTDDALVYAVICKGRSDLRLKGYVEKSVRPGEPLTVIFEPVLSGRNYQSAWPGIALVQPPQGAIERIRLTADPNGRLKGFIKDTRRLGRYLIWTEMHFLAPRRITTTRFRQVCGLVLDKKK
jgi:hypothetical protein